LPERGAGAALVLPVCNAEAMQLHLDEIATKVAPGAHAVLLLDRAGWHGAAALAVPDNISLLPLPSRSPELNPQENIWQFMRQNWLSNRIFKDYDDIVDHCCHAWSTLLDQPWKIWWANSMVLALTTPRTQQWSLCLPSGIDFGRDFVIGATLVVPRAPLTVLDARPCSRSTQNQ